MVEARLIVLVDKGKWVSLIVIHNKRDAIEIGVA